MIPQNAQGKYCLTLSLPGCCRFLLTLFMLLLQLANCCLSPLYANYTRLILLLYIFNINFCLR